MGVCGIPQPLEDHAVRCVEMGMDMLECVKNVVSPVDAHPVKVQNHTIVYAITFCLDTLLNNKDRNMTSCNRGKNIFWLFHRFSVIKVGRECRFQAFESNKTKCFNLGGVD